jgi:hypothetical protein
MSRRTRLLLYYYLTLAFACAITMVGPVFGGLIDKLGLTAPGAPIGCKFVDFGSLVGANVNDGGDGRTVGTFDYAAGLINSAPDTVKLVLDGGPGETGSAVDIDFSFELAGFTSPAAVTLALNGVSSGMSGFFGISLTAGGGVSCAFYDACLEFGTGSISMSTGPVVLPAHLDPVTVYGRLSFSGTGSLSFGPNSADIEFSDSPAAVPEPASALLLTGALAIMALLRRRISRA